DDGVLFIAQGIAGGGVLQTNSSSDIASVHLFNILTMVCVHLQDTDHTLVVVLHGVVNGRTSVYSTGIHTEEAQLTNEGVGGNLKGQSCEGSLIRRRTGLFFFGVGVDALNSGNIGGGGHIVDNCVQQRLHALVLIGSTAANGNHVLSDGRLTDAVLNLFHGQLLAAQILLKELVVLFGDMLDQFGVILLGQLHHILGDILLADVLAQVIIIDFSSHGN